MYLCLYAGTGFGDTIGNFEVCTTETYLANSGINTDVYVTLAERKHI